jgi:SAM-dependent methyltransferase
VTLALIALGALAGVGAATALTVLAFRRRRLAVTRANARIERRLAQRPVPSARECPCCGLICDSFEPFGGDQRPDARCPACDSLEPHRLTWLYLLNETDLLCGEAARRMLHLAPEVPSWQWPEQAPTIEFVGADDPARPLAGLDPTALPFGEESFGVVCCEQALERVADRERAIAELRRVLRVGGWALVQVPTPAPREAEDPDLLSESDEVCLERAQELARGGFEVTVDPYPRRIGAACSRRFGLALHEQILFVRKGALGGRVIRLSPDAAERSAPAFVPGAIPVFCGRVERVHDGIVSGWVWQPQMPDHRVRVQALVDGEAVAEGLADLERRSLVSAGIGDGRHGFEISLPERLARRGRHRLCVQPEGAVALAPATAFEVIVERAPALWRDVGFGVEGFVVGRVEQVRDGVILGWVWDPDRSGGVPVRVFLDGVDVGGCVADLPRHSPADADACDGRYGFRFLLPARLADGGVHGFRVEAHGLALGPAASFTTGAAREEPGFTLESPGVREHAPASTDGVQSSVEDGVLGRVEQASGGIVSGWAYRPGAPAWRVWVDVTTDGTQVCGGVANLHRASLAAAGIGDGRHGFRFSVPPAAPGTGQQRLRVEAEGVILPARAGLGNGNAPSHGVWHGVELFLDASCRARSEPTVIERSPSIPSRSRQRAADGPLNQIDRSITSRHDLERSRVLYERTRAIQLAVQLRARELDGVQAEARTALAAVRRARRSWAARCARRLRWSARSSDAARIARHANELDAVVAALEALDQWPSDQPRPVPGAGLEADTHPGRQ